MSFKLGSYTRSVWESTKGLGGSPKFTARGAIGGATIGSTIGGASSALSEDGSVVRGVLGGAVLGAGVGIGAAKGISMRNAYKDKKFRERNDKMTVSEEGAPPSRYNPTSFTG